MGQKRRRKKNSNERLEVAVRPRSIPEYFQQLFYEGILNNPSDFIAPPLNPLHFGYQRPELLYKSPLITGQILFDDPFYNVLPPPPFGKEDPTYPEWLEMVDAAQRRSDVCQPGQESPACTKARNNAFDAARKYATALDRVWGLNHYQEEGQNAKTKTTSFKGATGKAMNCSHGAAATSPHVPAPSSLAPPTTASSTATPPTASPPTTPTRQRRSQKTRT